MAKIRNGKTYQLRCPGCGKRTATLTLDRPFNPVRDDIAYCGNRKTCPLPAKPFRIINANLPELRKAKLLASVAEIVSGTFRKERK